MTSTLRQIQADYESRAALAQVINSIPEIEEVKPKATRTYTGAALARRQAWGRQWGGILSAVSHQLRDED